MQSRIESLNEKKLVGKSLTMNFAHNTTGELWKSFMLQRGQIENPLGAELYSVQLYPQLFFEKFNPQTHFEKWATVEVENFNRVPLGMDTLVLPAGLYAVFDYKGNSTGAEEAFRYIFGTWLPNSEYVLDLRPHFEVLGEKYKRDDPDSEEEIWIPIKAKD